VPFDLRALIIFSQEGFQLTGPNRPLQNSAVHWSDSTTTSVCQSSQKNPLDEPTIQYLSH